MKDGRIKALEEASAHHAAALDDVATQMTDQWAAIRRLEKKLDLVIEHLRASRDQDDGAGEVIDRPPHY